MQAMTLPQARDASGNREPGSSLRTAGRNHMSIQYLDCKVHARQWQALFISETKMGVRGRKGWMSVATCVDAEPLNTLNASSKDLNLTWAVLLQRDCREIGRSSAHVWHMISN